MTRLCAYCCFAIRFKPGTENVANKLQDLRRGDQPLEDFAFIDEVCEPASTRFFSEFGTGVLAFLFVELLYALPNLLESLRIENVFDHDVTETVEIFIC